MSMSAANAAERAVNRLVARLAENPQLAAELQRARREYFGLAADGDVTTAAAPELRFREWFVCERESERHGAVPLELPLAADEVDELADSVAGLWLVQAVAPDGTAAQDLQDGSVVDLVAPSGSLHAGDLIVGRLFPVGAGRFVPSVAAAVFRPGVVLAQAFTRDLERLRLERRLLQVELEHLMLQRTGEVPAGTLAAPPARPLEHLEADLEALLRRAGARHSAAALSQQLAGAAQPGAVLGPVLDELAFDTAIDLDQARELLVRIWNAHHAGDGIRHARPVTQDADPTRSLGERLAQVLDQGLAAKRDLEALFADVERQAGIEPQAEDDGDGDGEWDAAPAGGAADAAVGNLAPLIEEYLLETGRGDDAAAGTLRLLHTLQGQAALPHIDLEELTAVDVLRVLLHIYLAAPPGERAQRTRAALAEFTAFCRWAESAQDQPMQGVLAGVRGGLVDDLDRLEAAGIALSSPASDDVRPGVLTIDEVHPHGFGASDDYGGDHWLLAATEAVAHLRIGDLVLGALRRTTGGAVLTGLVVVLPADARALIE